MFVYIGFLGTALVEEDLFGGQQGWRGGESGRVPPMWPGFDFKLVSYVG